MNPSASRRGSGQCHRPRCFLQKPASTSQTRCGQKRSRLLRQGGRLPRSWSPICSAVAAMCLCHGVYAHRRQLQQRIPRRARSPTMSLAASRGLARARCAAVDHSPVGVLHGSAPGGTSAHTRGPAKIARPRLRLGVEAAERFLTAAVAVARAGVVLGDAPRRATDLLGHASLGRRF